MDPKACLEEIRSLCEDIFYTLDVHEKADLGLELSEKIQDLDTWLSNGGFSPWGD